MAEDLSRKISEALAALAGEVPLREGAKGVLNALGYESARTAEAGSVEEFLDRFRPERPLTDKQRRLFDDWRKVEIVFQVTDDEIELPPDQRGLFDGPGFDRGRAKSFLFLAVDMQSGAYRRTDLAEATRAVNRLFRMPVIVLFRHGLALTLAAIHRRAHKRDDNRDVLEKVTLVKDIRLEDPHRAHIEILSDLALTDMIRTGVRSFDDLHVKWEQVLDIEALNKRFYKELFNWFERATEECRFPDDGAGDGCTQRNVIRLITRLLFIWFLKEKGLVPDELFEERFAREQLKHYTSKSTGYYRAVLQNLFFATLNTEIDRRAFSTRTSASHRDFSRYRYRGLLADPEGFVEKLRQVPFVNGGLFDCLDDFAAASEGGRRIDAFTDNINTQGRDLHVPARLLLHKTDGLFALFRHYKFTIEENTPLDAEVALDPELLGRVFENLLAAYNPETRKTARKATGSYYTPRQVVDYMVREALTEALVSKSEPTDGDADFWRERIDYLLDHSAAMDDAADLFSAPERRALVASIAGLRTLDPAVGSGAFPMGILQTLTMALRRLDPGNALWEAFQKERAAARAEQAFDTEDRRQRDDQLTEISATFDRYRQTDFGRKLYLIQNGIYGVDIQPIACQVAKLRFFISLTIEQDPDPMLPNFGIKPLPNLETRLIAANTLIMLERPNQGELGHAGTVFRIESEISSNRERYFHAPDRRTKQWLQNRDTKLRIQLSNVLQQNGFPSTTAGSIADWDPFDQNASANWFDSEYMFGVTKGFDIVIGNPPYVVSNDKKLRKIYAESARGRPNLYGYFIHCSLQTLLADKGTLIFINPRTLLTDAYFSKLRTFILKNSQIHSILNIINRRNIFENVLQSCIINCFRKTEDESPIKVRNVSRKEDISSGKWVEVQTEDFLLDQKGSILYIVAGSETTYAIFQKLKKLDTFGMRGISFVTGKVQWDTFRTFLGPTPNQQAARLIWAENVQRYFFAEAKRRIDKVYMNSVTMKLEPITHDTIIVQRTTAIEQNYRIIAHIFSPNRFELPIHAENDTSYMLDLTDVDIRFVLGLLNSKFIDFIFRHINSNTHVSAGELNSLPFPEIGESSQEQIITLVDRILEARRADVSADTSKQEAEIDRLVYTLYGLDEREVAAVEDRFHP